MAEAAHPEDYQRGDMDIQAHRSTFHLFSTLTKWFSLHLAALLSFLVLWFCTPAGFLGGLIVGLVVAGVGIAVLRDKSAPAH